MASDASEERAVLSDLESSMAIQMQQGVTTTTFFTGEVQTAAAFLRERLREIASANPWIAGRVVRDKQAKNLQLAYPKGPVTEVILDELLRVNPPGLSISSKITYSELCKAVAVSKALLPPQSKLVNKPDLVTRVTLTSDPTDPSCFAMVFSMSHTVADGYTYFSILNMLSQGRPIKVLSPTRHPEVEARCNDVAKGDIAYTTSCSWTCAALSKMLCKPKNKYYARYVDSARIKKAKGDAVNRGAKFVSTNDILTSTYGNLTQSRMMLMAMNLRGRVEGASDINAGNYETTLWLDEAVYKHPERVREMLAAGAPFKGREKPAPGVCEAAGSPMTVMSNWATFGGSVILPNCQHMLQLPMVDLSFVPVDMAIIFAPKDRETAVIYGLKYVNDESLCKQAPLGSKVSDTLF